MYLLKLLQSTYEKTQESFDVLRTLWASIYSSNEERLSPLLTNISQHLSIMKSKGIVTSDRKGKNIYYKLTNPKIIKAFDIIREVLSERLRGRML